MLIVSLLLLIEARRYRFFDVYRSRVRQLERHYFAQVMSPQAEITADWASTIVKSLRKPTFFITYREAVFRRIRRNYTWMYLILVMAWGLKISSPKLMPNDTEAEVVNRWSDVVAFKPIRRVAERPASCDAVVVEDNDPCAVVFEKFC